MISEYDFNQIIRDDKKRLILVIYDIIDDKRRLKMVKLLESYGHRIQKSAFEAVLLSSKYDKLVKDIGKIVNDEDDVRVYRLNQTNEVVAFGNGVMSKEEITVII